MSAKNDQTQADKNAGSSVERRLIETNDLRELAAHNAELKGTYEELGWRNHQLHELNAQIEALTAKANEARREYDKAMARVSAKYQTPPGTKFNLTTGEIFTPDHPAYHTLS